MRAARGINQLPGYPDPSSRFADAPFEHITNAQLLADLLDVEPITLGRIVDKLQSMGLIERHADPKDRRVWLLRSTAAARPKLAQVRKLGDLTRAEALEGVSDEGQRRLLRTLQTLKINLTKACEAPVAQQKRTRNGQT